MKEREGERERGRETEIKRIRVFVWAGTPISNER